MTGHKPDSHKKKKKTWLEDTDKKPAAKRLCLIWSPVPVTTPPVVTQTQESTQGDVFLQDTGLVVATPDIGSPTNANNVAIANMAAGATNVSTTNDDAVNHIDFDLHRLQRF